MTGSRARNVAVILAGCGVHDGTEIHEAVLVLLALDRAGAEVRFFAPDIAQRVVVSHQTGDMNSHDSRNVRIESARIARGPVADLATLRARDVDALVLPGGYGTTRNLSDYAVRGRACTVVTDVGRVIRDAHAAGKPIAAICTAPVLVAKVLGASAPKLTIGRDATIASDIESWGARHETCDVRDIVVDRDNRIVSTPAYMLATRIGDAMTGIERALRAMVELS